MTTGTRSHGERVADALELGLWHLPAEKGLSLRRAARQVRSGRTGRLRRDLADPARAARRFKVQGTGLPRQIRDDGWLVSQRVLGAVRSALPSR